MQGGSEKQGGPEEPRSSSSSSWSWSPPPRSPSAGGLATWPRRELDSPAPAATEREQLLDRLQSMREMLPVFAQEAASARRLAARLRTENRCLAEEVRRLRQARASA